MNDIDALLRAPRPVRLDSLALRAALRVLVLAPHPDGFDAIGVAMRHLDECGCVIHVAVATTGASGVDNGWDEAYTNEQKAAIREAEQRASCRFFGLPDDRLSFLRLWEDGDEEIEPLRRHLHAIRPDIVCLPHGNDSNRTHRRVYEALRDIAASGALEMWALLNRDAKTIAMREDVYMGFDDADAAWKTELLRFHRSQQARNLRSRGQGFDARVLDLNRGIAQAAGLPLPYAEAFELQRLGTPVAP